MDRDTWNVALALEDAEREERSRQFWDRQAKIRAARLRAESPNPASGDLREEQRPGGGRGIGE